MEAPLCGSEMDMDAEDLL